MEYTREQYDYDSLPESIQVKLAELIASDTLIYSNQFYKEVEIQQSFYAKYGKRFLDIIISVLALVISLPINVILCIVTFFDVGLPLFFVQQRIGMKHKTFKMVKFRNMNDKRDANGVLLRADLRVTKWGKFVRAASLDELLNFVNVLKGEMSIIGPRPLPIQYKGRFNQYHDIRHMVKPGLDCPLRDRNNYLTWENRLENDVWYASHISFKTDIKLFLLLFIEIFAGKDKKNRAEGVGEGTFMGYFEDGRVMDSNHIPEKYYKAVLHDGKDNALGIKYA